MIDLQGLERNIEMILGSEKIHLFKLRTSRA
jgi:hypothetical protein